MGVSTDAKVSDIEDIKLKLPEIQKPNTQKPDLSKRAAGLKCLSQQRETLACRKGAVFSIMLAGSRGTGKTTFFNTLFGTELLSLEEERSVTRVDGISVDRFELQESKFKLNLQVIETKDYGNSLDNSNAWKTICKFIDDQFLKYLQQSQQPCRKDLVDSRVHCCLYFLNPSKCSLCDLDIETMKNLSTRVNLIPVISKSDILTPDELVKFKAVVKQALHDNEIQICQYFTDLDLIHAINFSVPFSIVGSIDRYKNDHGEFVKGRNYHWGLVEIENSKHCDFLLLKNILITENMLDFVLSTDTFYEKFRSSYLANKIESVLSPNENRDVTKLEGFQQLKAYYNVKALEKRKSSQEESQQQRIDFDEMFEKKAQELRQLMDKLYTEEDEVIKMKKQKLVKKQEEFRADLHKTNLKKKELLALIEAAESKSNISESSVLVNSDIASSQSSVNIVEGANCENA
ncbi:uncharacterized protein SPAPADRAFT_71136 [Spathaspora passalidarum NRRL Y-27907]|uniref:Septin-type G domain-containing protein n=1 Tax=Spathaspora passalidarum (strain NRRL Y-27907 / 11-Y1) TaxID=619300 RepID=G3ALM7_SPAPN|nr:uncharacterized protein SPAPADRAFT_71136 [Spathaspora passalidarum NRRL Y-27907]EGW33270.1 hypothetical protein SPAPADRAFT_71136 [Spathaspora passalidarum NRRL Y-27907]